MSPGRSRVAPAVARRRSVWAPMLLAAVLLAGGIPAAPAASGGDDAALDCSGWLGHPVPGSAEWNEADLNNQQCAAEGLRILQESPAVAAAKAANADAGEGDFVGDPFRGPRRWASKRGSYEQVTYTDRDGNTWPAALFSPTRRRKGAVPRRVARLPRLLPAPAHDRERRSLVLGRRDTRRSGLRRAIRHGRRQQCPTDDRRHRFLDGNSRVPDVARRVQSLVRTTRSQPSWDRRSLGRRWRRTPSRPQRFPLRRDRGLGPGRFLRFHRRDTAHPDDDPGRGLHPPRGTRAERREADPCSRLEVHLLRHDPRCRRGCHAGSRRARRRTSTGPVSQEPTPSARRSITGSTARWSPPTTRWRGWIGTSLR